MPQPRNPLLANSKRLRGGGWDESAVASEDMDDAINTEEIEVTEADEQDIASSVKQRWTRPSVAPFDTATTDINVQWLDIDMTVGPPLAANPAPGKAVVGSTVGPVPIIRVYGCSDLGNSVSLFIHGFTPYALFAVPPSYTNSSENLEQMRTLINERLR